MEWSCPVFKEINRSRNRIKGMETSGQDPTQISFQFVKAWIQVWWHMPLMPALGGRGKQISKSEASLIYRASSRNDKFKQ